MKSHKWIKIAEGWDYIVMSDSYSSENYVLKPLRSFCSTTTFEVLDLMAFFTPGLFSMFGLALYTEMVANKCCKTDRKAL